jgi:hypothetical protein
LDCVLKMSVPAGRNEQARWQRCIEWPGADQHSGSMRGNCRQAAWEGAGLAGALSVRDRKPSLAEVWLRED